MNQPMLFSELPKIDKWRIVFSDSAVEKNYMDWHWPAALKRYRLLFIFGIVMTFLDPSLYRRADLGAFLEGLVGIAIFGSPLILQRWAFFRRWHDLVCGGLIVTLQAVSIMGALNAAEQVTPNPTFLALIPMIMLMFIYGVFPFGFLAALLVIVVTIPIHYIAVFQLLEGVSLSPEYYPVSIGIWTLSALIMVSYHREMEMGRRAQYIQLEALGKSKADIEATFRSYMGGTVGESILSDSVRLDGEDRWVSILFTDLRGYSTIIEPMSPKQVLGMLNDYFSEMGAIIDRHEGVVLEYIGDAMMIVFGAPHEVEDHQIKAVKCAMEMRAHMDAMNQKWVEKGLARFWKNQGIEELSARAGIHTGNIVAGNIGGKNKLKYGAIGDVVNIAARLEQANKSMGSNILFSRAVYVALPEELISQTEDKGTIHLKGRSNEEQVYSI